MGGGGGGGGGAWCDDVGLKKGPWTPDEDQKLLAYIHQHGFRNSWTTLPQKAGLQRCGKSCRLRWMNYLRPDVKRGKFSLQEQRTIIQLHAFLGNRWSAIAAHLPNRTDNEIKNYWNTHIKKKFTKLGIDPTTHRPISNTAAATLSHTAQWERARLEAEARLANKEPRAKACTKPSSSSSSSANSTTKSQCLDVLKAWQSLVAGMFDPSKPSTTTTTIPHEVEGPANELGSAWIDEDDQLIMLGNRSNQMAEELTVERFDNLTSLHYDDSTAFNWMNSAAVAEDILEDFPDIFVPDFDCQIEHVDQNSSIN